MYPHDFKALCLNGSCLHGNGGFVGIFDTVFTQ